MAEHTWNWNTEDTAEALKKLIEEVGPRDVQAWAISFKAMKVSPKGFWKPRKRGRLHPNDLDMHILFPPRE